MSNSPISWNKNTYLLPEAMVKIQKFQDEYLIIHLEQPIHYNGFDDFLGSCLLSQRSENNTKATTKRSEKSCIFSEENLKSLFSLVKYPNYQKAMNFKSIENSKKKLLRRGKNIYWWLVEGHVFGCFCPKLLGRWWGP